MTLQEIVDSLAPLVDPEVAKPTGDGMKMVLYMTRDQYKAVETVVSAMQLAQLMNYKQAQDSFPRLLNAVKLVLAIADHPDQNPTEQISLAPKTRAQLDSALKFAENKDRVK
jgi:hypothetical protein